MPDRTDRATTGSRRGVLGRVALAVTGVAVLASAGCATSSGAARHATASAIDARTSSASHRDGSTPTATLTSWAQQLLDRAPLPRDAHRSRSVPVHLLDALAPVAATRASAHAWWTTSGSVDDVTEYGSAHPLAGWAGPDTTSWGALGHTSRALELFLVRRANDGGDAPFAEVTLRVARYERGSAVRVDVSAAPAPRRTEDQTVPETPGPQRGTVVATRTDAITNTTTTTRRTLGAASSTHLAGLVDRAVPLSPYAGAGMQHSCPAIPLRWRITVEFGSTGRVLTIDFRDCTGPSATVSGRDHRPFALADGESLAHRVADVAHLPGWPPR